VAFLAVLGAAACGRAFTPPPAGAPERARAAATYSASLRVSLKAPGFRARTRALIAFRRPDELRLEVPGPTGPRLVAVTSGGRLTAVFPGERAVFEGEASAEAFASLLGVGLSPMEVMDLLVGEAPVRLRSYRAGWKGALPEVIEATLPDGGRLALTVEEPQTDPSLGPAAFVAPGHPGYRSIAAEEARTLWNGR
jgi:hypothetical protein